ncbi:MAG: ATP phosphoribosyltransferase [archaeon]
MKNQIKLGIPKGSLQEATIKLFGKAGFNIIVNERSYKPLVDDDEISCLLIKAKEIPKYVEKGVLDIGISGEDCILETKSEVEEIEELLYSKQRFKKVKLVLAVSKDSNIKSLKDLQGKRIATEFVNITRDYLEKNNVNAEVEFSWGATEVKVPALVDAISELTETGASLEANNLKIIDTILESTTKLIANKSSMQDSWKKQKINQISTLLKAALDAEGKVGLKMNIEKKNLDKLVKIIPALKNPTISDLTNKDWVAVETIINEEIVREIIPKLKEVGASGIVEFPLNKIIH